VILLCRNETAERPSFSLVPRMGGRQRTANTEMFVPTKSARLWSLVLFVVGRFFLLTMLLISSVIELLSNVHDGNNLTKMPHGKGTTKIRSWIDASLNILCPIQVTSQIRHLTISTSSTRHESPCIINDGIVLVSHAWSQLLAMVQVRKMLKSWILQWP
jgi:hypothetical protein